MITDDASRDWERERRAESRFRREMCEPKEGEPDDANTSRTNETERP